MMRSFSARRGAVLLACLTAVGSCVMGKQAATKPAVSPSVVAADPAVKRVVQANTDFGFRLFHQLVSGKRTGNVFFSPFSVSNALTMTLNGAGGTTERDMVKTLGLGGMSLAQINQGNGLLMPSLAAPDPKVQVSVANALWANKNVTLALDFRERCRRFYTARAESLDLASPAAVGTINGWVNQNTHGRITRLVSHADIAQSMAVLTNAIYFHGKWQTPFDKAETQNAPFLLGGNHTKNVPLMQQEGRFSYSETPRGQAISLPYGDGRMSLYVLLPKAGRRVDDLAKGLDAKAWAVQVAGMKQTRVTLFLPRFKAEYRAQLKGPLSELGMGAAFGAGADFQPMGLQGACIGEVIHEAVVDVDEQGTVAAAATGVVMMPTAAMPTPSMVMRVDRPFLIVLRDNATGAILFEGVIRDPQ